MIGQTISHYRILSQLGQGGMGVVYEAEDTRLGRRVAIKVLPTEACCDAQAMERFLREARIVSSLNHPHICTLHDIGEHDGEQFMVMELIEGESLKARIARGPLPVDEVLELGLQMADALDAAHARGVVHRDIKPANLFVTSRGQIKVLDFGVAKLAQGGQPRAGELAETRASEDALTTLGTAIGTVAYMSPEQARGHEIDARSDLFSVGVVLYEMATGGPPFPGTTPAVVFEGILTKAPEPPSSKHTEVPPELDRIILKALEKDREVRYQSAADLRADLKRLRRETEGGRTAATSGVTAAAPAAAPAPPSRIRLAWLVGAPVVTLAVVAVALLWQSTRTPALSARDLIVLSDFVNRTGDPVFDDTLAEALALQLRQSPFLNLVTDQQVQATLRLMGREPMERVTPELGLEICQRAGAKAMLGGTITGLGSAYVLTLNARDCVTGDVLAEAQAQAGGKEMVLHVLGEAASRFREELGESLASVQRYDARIEEATTPSLDALKAYSQGMSTRRTQGSFASVPFFVRAIELDPEFALAHARLGTVYSNMGEVENARTHTARAYELRDKVSERERYYIDARYFSVVARDIDRAIEAYRLWKTTYPTDFTPYVNLGSLYRGRGEPGEAIQNLEEGVRLAPDEPLARLNLGFAYLDVNRVDEARAAFEGVLALTEDTQARAGLVTIGVVTGDDALVDAQVAASRGSRDEVDLLITRASGALYQGRVARARTLFDDVRIRLRDLGRLEKAGEGILNAAIGFALAGDAVTARALLAEARALGATHEGTADEEVVLGAVLLDAELARAALPIALEAVGEGADARAAARLLRAIALDAQGRPGEALEALGPVTFERRNLQAVYMFALQSLRAGRWDDATRALEWMHGQVTLFELSPARALSNVMLARAHAGAGRVAEARAAYEAFFEFWKAADPDAPLLVEARAEYAEMDSR
ncbi:MAG: protein kinase [Vicinamibacterales bacterium]|nr:protein kinase [Vicinamibacterales bacterium]